jgi:hypothetical protein
MTMLMGYASYYIFSFGVHENHFILATIMALLLYLYKRTPYTLWLLVGVEVVNFLNMFLFYGILGEPIVPRILFGIDLSMLLAGIISIAGMWYIVSTKDYIV